MSAREWAYGGDGASFGVGLTVSEARLQALLDEVAELRGLQAAQKHQIKVTVETAPREETEAQEGGV
jgi:hypothetical protein